MAFVDHKPLPLCMSEVAEPWSARQQRRLSYISEYTTDIRHVAGKSNVVADCLSRTIIGATGPGLCPYECGPGLRVRGLRSSEFGLEEVAVGNSDVKLRCDVSTGQPRLLVPVNWRRPVFEALHGLSHPGRKPSVKLISQKFVWQGLRRDVGSWVSSCVDCQRSEVHRHIKAPLGEFKVPERRFDHVNVDLVGPLPSSHGFTYLFTMVDRTTRWPEAVPLSSASTSDVARAFLGTWVAHCNWRTHVNVPKNVEVFDFIKEIFLQSF